MSLRWIGCAVAVFLLIPGTALAQEPGKKGLTVAYPAAIGAIWHVTEKIAVRPDFTFSSSSFDTSSVESSNFGTGLGVSALFYVKKWDSVSAYITPRIGWTHIRAKAESTFFEDVSESTTNAYSFSGSFGAQAWIRERFSVFGEVGIAYTKNTFDAEFTTQTQNSHSFGMRSGVGVVLYF